MINYTTAHTTWLTHVSCVDVVRDDYALACPLWPAFCAPDTEKVCREESYNDTDDAIISAYTLQVYTQL